MTPETYLTAHRDLIKQIRRELHRIPEPGTQERKTGERIRSYLDAWQIPYHFPVADTGIVARIQGTGEGDGSDTVVALRADMDGLPVKERKKSPFSSLHTGMMHACGHDAHMAIALGCCQYFQQNREEFSGCVKFFFQPAEETTGGALRMISEGCMEDPKVDYCIGLHVAPGIETGSIELKYGPLYASSDEVHLTVLGSGSHGAYPDLGTDAILMAATLITSLQSLVSRNVSPLDQAVLTLGTIQGGQAHNILADRVTLTGTLRTTSAKTRELAKQVIRRQTAHIAQAFGGQAEALFLPGYDALCNTDAVVSLLRQTVEPILGLGRIIWKETPGMGVEDFSYFLEQAPGVFYHLGCKSPSKETSAPLHSPEFELDEDCLAIGVRLQAELALALMKRGSIAGIPRSDADKFPMALTGEENPAS